MTIKDLNERSLSIFKELVEAYMENKEPVGSRTISRRIRDDLSPATIRNVMADLEEAQLLFSPHTSAGRIPTEKGLRFFLESLLEERDLNAEEKKTFKAQCQTMGKNVDEVMQDASSALSGLSQCASIVLVPKFESVHIKYIEFLMLSEHKGLVILITDSGTVENRLFSIPHGVTPFQLSQASQYINKHLEGKTLVQAQEFISTKIHETEIQFDSITNKIIEEGLASWAEDTDKNALIIKGQSRLLENVNHVEDIEKVRNLFDELDKKETLQKLLSASIEGEGVKIFMGAEHPLFQTSGCSMVASPYKNTEGRVVGAIGVIGPSFMNYRRIIPMVSYSAKMLSRLFK